MRRKQSFIFFSSSLFLSSSDWTVSTDVTGTELDFALAFLYSHGKIGTIAPSTSTEPMVTPRSKTCSKGVGFGDTTTLSSASPRIPQISTLHSSCQVRTLQIDTDSFVLCFTLTKEIRSSPRFAQTLLGRCHSK